MRIFERLGKVLVIFAAFALATYFALQFGSGSLWKGFEPALAVTGQSARPPYDLTRLEAVNETLRMIRDKYVDPDRVRPKEMLLSALNYVQRDVAQVIVMTDDPNEVTVRVETAEKKFRIDNVQAPWDVAGRLREIFAFLQQNLKGTEVDLREVEYAACNGMLHTLDPHSVFMSPDAYKEMSLSTSGAFGGLGIVISIRKQQLTIIEPMPDTPAGRAGLRCQDRIVKINNESTLNMPLEDAVRRLRGEPGTKVTVWVTRDGEDAPAKGRDASASGSTCGGATFAVPQNPKPYELVREIIKVKSVESRSLDNGVGYIRLKQFQQSSSDEVGRALNEMRTKGPIRGLVLDLRGNPGGLLDQAVKIADKFLTDGVIVSTVGASEGRDEKRAKLKQQDADTLYPIVVLVSGNSASASEIVAGALKNHDRAVIVGQTTFGKGSVQLVFPDVTPEKAALKLTIAQYLTPGDVSIQGVGVTPDIELDPMTVDELEMDFMVQKDGLRERDLSAHLSNSRAQQGSKPIEVVRFQYPSAEREADRTRICPEDFKIDFPIRFGRDLAQRLPAATKRADQVKAARDFIEQIRKEELSKVSAELSKLGVDWAEPPADASDKKTTFEVKAETAQANNQVTAGDPMELRVTVKNTGTEPVYRLRASTESDNPYFTWKELVFGKIAPGATKTAKVPLGFCERDEDKIDAAQDKPGVEKRQCRIPKDALSRADGMKIMFESGGGGAPAPVELQATIKALDRPLFQYSYQIADDRSGNGDGRVQKGEQVSMYLTVKNAGKGRSYKTQANISNLSGEGLLLHGGRFDISNMQPGDTCRVLFTFDVNKQLTESDVTLALSVVDRELGEIAREKVKIPIEAPLSVEKATGTKKAEAGATLRPAPDAAVRAFGKLPAGALLGVVGKSGDFWKVDLGRGRFGFVASKEVADASGNAAAPQFDDIYSHAPPTLDVSAAEMATRNDKVKITGVAADSEKLLDIYIFVGSRKLYYKSNRDGADPRKATIDFDAPLRPGVNYVNVYARENPDTVTRRTIVVRKDGADGTLLKTPKSDDPVDDWTGADVADE